MYSPDQYEIVSEINSVACVTAVSLIFGRKIAAVDGPIYYVRGLILTLYGLTWAFDLIACMLVSTNNGNYISCTLGFFNCVLFYTFAKIMLYLYFTEKIYVMSMPKVSRMRSIYYHAAFAILALYLGCIVFLIISRIIEVDDASPYHCIIGYSLPATITILCCDFLIAALCTGMFIKLYAFPSMAQQTAQQASSLKLMARRHIIAAIVPCITSTVNYVIMVALQGRERGLIALAVCTVDITIVSCVVHWVTSHPAESHLVEKGLHAGGGDRPVKLEIKQHQEVVVLTELNSRM
ncbi:hypothetical protein O0I10_003589 [Lichtheimia ornata]|uniref:Uncharacterized protein n=1 Tax=Lichtheimia ornata TaxID=688661 RepID=A0AAD7V716_9FUNG|nr:uncharacterized protein O0I10_003589 [Lichtheimia ornata]KAJ8660543.1 hypothetical protein O0I10_003589 [Lichtheimia ornata]